MGKPGIEVVEWAIPKIVREYKIDLVIAQSENVSQGKGITVQDYHRLQKAGIDFFTGGNWSLNKSEIVSVLQKPEEPIIRPANYPDATPGMGFKYIKIRYEKVLVISLLGQIVGKDSDKPVDNPLQSIDKILISQKAVKRSATIVNFHGDFSSEKVVIGHYLDGRVTAVIGDHWHVPTADARVLPGGTAHITDVGMCGVLDSSLGVKYNSVIPRWRDGLQTRNELEINGSKQFNAVIIQTDLKGLANTIGHIRMIT